MTGRSIADDIRDEIAGLQPDADTKKAIESWLAADREFNTWFLVTTKRALGDDDLMDLLDGYRESQDTMTSAWKSFRDESDGPKLQALIATSVARMHDLMHKG